MVIFRTMFPPLRTSLILLISLLPITMATTSSSSPLTPRTCYICYNCLKYEAASQARQCDEPEEQFCLVRFLIIISLLKFSFWCRRRSLRLGR